MTEVKLLESVAQVNLDRLFDIARGRVSEYYSLHQRLVELNRQLVDHADETEYILFALYKAIAEKDAMPEEVRNIKLRLVMVEPAHRLVEVREVRVAELDVPNLYREELYLHVLYERREVVERRVKFLWIEKVRTEEVKYCYWTEIGALVEYWRRRFDGAIEERRPPATLENVSKYALIRLVNFLMNVDALQRLVQLVSPRPEELYIFRIREAEGFRNLINSLVEAMMEYKPKKR